MEEFSAFFTVCWLEKETLLRLIINKVGLCLDTGMLPRSAEASAVCMFLLKLPLPHLLREGCLLNLAPQVLDLGKIIQRR